MTPCKWTSEFWKPFDGSLEEAAQASPSSSSAAQAGMERGGGGEGICEYIGKEHGNYLGPIFRWRKDYLMV